jgi:hypothetical protein
MRQKRTVPYAAHMLVGEDAVFVVVGPAAGLFDESRRKTMGVSFVVRELGVDEIVDLLSCSHMSITSRLYTVMGYDIRSTGKGVSNRIAAAVMFSH